MRTDMGVEEPRKGDGLPFISFIEALMYTHAMKGLSFPFHLSDHSPIKLAKPCRVLVGVAFQEPRYVVRLANFVLGPLQIEHPATKMYGAIQDGHEPLNELVIRKSLGGLAHEEVA